MQKTVVIPLFLFNPPLFLISFINNQIKYRPFQIFYNALLIGISR